MHSIKIFTLLEDDQDLENDTLQKVVVNTLASGDGFYAINFDGVDDIIDAGTLNNVNLQSFTYETWTNPSGYGAYGQSGFGRLFEGKAATIFFHGENNNNYPNHCLVISSIGGGTYYTDLNSIELNKWQHIAVSFNNDTKELKVHLNGQEIHVNVKSIAGTIADNSTNSLYIGNRPNLDRQYQGIIDEARIWNIARSQEEINSGMFVHQTGEDGLIAEFSFDEGYYFNETKSGEIKATILNAKLEPGENSIWTEPTKLFTEISFNDQVSELLEVSENTYSCDVLSDTDLSTILPEFTITYPNVKAYYENNIIESGNTVIDFSTSETNPVKIEFRANLFGKDLVETMHYIVKNEANSECELISFSMLSANNASLTKDIIANPVSQSMTFAPNPEADISALVVNFELSEGAKAIYNNTELISGSSSLDFNNPVIITIVAANGRTKNYYGVNFLKTQIISWNPENTTFIYGDNEVLLDGLASSGLEVVYHSDNENIIKPVDNKLIITGTGTVNITASQEGSSTTVPAIPVIKQFTINKATLIAKANDVHVGYSQPIPEFTISYNGFVNNEDPSVIDMKPTASTLATQNSEPGEYVILISGGNDDNYSISPENGILTITKDTEFLTEFSVVNGNGSLNAYMGEEELSSGSNVNSGSEITFNAEPNDGYQVKEWTLNGNIITDNNTNTLTVSDIHKETTVTVEFEETPIQTYMVDFGVSNGNGILKAYMGEEELSSGSNVNAGSEITFNAEPNDAYQVKEWTVNGNIVTDINTNTLTISDIKEETTVTVEFEEIPPVTYPVNFSVINGNGSIAALVNNSEINSGNQVIEASAVVFTANPADAYRVKEWTVNGTIITDNNTNTLTISDIKEETTVTVEFEEIPVQTYMVDFSVLNGNGILKAYMGEEELSSGSIVNAGSEIICKAEPNVGYQVKEWTVNGNIVSDNNTETYTSSEVNEDITLSVEFENTTSVDNNFSETRIYPNPFDNWITIEHKTSVNRIDIINISGQKLIHMNVNGALKTKINTQALKSGIYILKLHYTNGEAQIHKLIK